MLFPYRFKTLIFFALLKWGLHLVLQLLPALEALHPIIVQPLTFVRSKGFPTMSAGHVQRAKHFGEIDFLRVGIALYAAWP
jgi:hypothetical protein